MSRSATSPQTPSWTDGLCEGLTVLELASVLAGPSVGQFFAELGARVIKVENPCTQGDVTRTWKTATEPDSDRSAYFHACNWGKESVAIDLRGNAGIRLLHELVAASDIVISNYLPRAAKKFEADFDQLKKVKSDIILGTIVGYAPDSDRPGYDAIIQAEAGYYHINASPTSEGWKPAKMPVALMDVLAGHQLKQALLMALLRRERTGQGAEVVVSLYEAAVSGLVNQATNWLVGGKVPAPLGSAHPNIAPYGSVYTTLDAHPIILGVGTDKQFVSLCDILGKPEWADDPQFKTNQLRVINRTALNDCLQSAIGSVRREIMLSACEEKGIPAGAVRQMDEVIGKTAGHLLLLDDANKASGVRETAIWPPAAPQESLSLSAPPSYAANTSQVLREVLSMDQKHIDSLIAEGTIVQS
ncbi:MAG: CaiB/BaiF CoA-transferase family protein [Bacteroidetes bacterium]|nr:CaiB/BaiF CoA-transferase family protein [Bacteroidota bacterium]MDA1333441.1 CaiB/BaiF CoA-transferase family protein [Bacteroidota bacterium]